MDLIDEARRDGAECVAGGKRVVGPGNWIQPTLLAG
jgi:acyl-CoA reductase-like NAD-dependent aldehyde dehydrogenase